MQQTSEPNFPDIVRLAISKLGVTIIHPKTKVNKYFIALIHAVSITKTLCLFSDIFSFFVFFSKLSDSYLNKNIYIFNF